MSLSEVQARTQALQARLSALSGVASTGGVVDSGSGSFAAALTSASAVSAPSVAVTAGPIGAKAVGLASQQIGTPYVFGGDKPGGFDCSGLVQWTYAQLGVALPRTSAEQGKAGVEVTADQAQPGDLVYFDHDGPVDHIGIYQGNGSWVVAPHTGAQVRVEKVDLSKATSIRRVTGAAPDPSAWSSAPTAWARALPPAGQQLSGQIERAAQGTGVDPRLLSAVAWTESDFNPNATSGAGAQGLMQLMPQTAAGLGVDPLDPAQALKGGATYLGQQLTAFGGRPDLALAAYNAGPTAVQKAGGIPPYPETQAYVEKVLSRYRQLGGTA